MSAPRDPWDREIIPSCPPVCVWRETCSTGTQQGIAELWAAGRITQPAECIFFARRARLHFDTTGQGVPGSLEELRQQLATHKAAQAEAGPA